MNLGKDRIQNLFIEYFIPTVSAMIITALYIIVDGIFVGQGVGSKGLAAVGVVIPMFTVFQSIQLLFGIGGSTVAFIALAKDKKDYANNIFLQATLFTILIMLSITVISLIYTEELAVFMGASQEILTDVKTYYRTMVIYAVFSTLNPMWAFFIRLDGAPKYAMFSMMSGAIINVILDYLFIFPMGMGIYGAALATGLGHITSVAIFGYYFMKKSKNFKFSLPEVSIEDLKRMIKIGIPGFITNIFTSVVMVTFNTVVIRTLGTDGVSTYGIINYLHPLILFIFMSIGQSIQPIASYNYGKGYISRVNEVYIFAQKIALFLGITFTLIGVLGSRFLVSLFLDNSSSAFSLAVKNIPVFYINYLFYGITSVAVSFYQAVEETTKANLITLGRGFIFIMISLLLLPKIMGDMGIWMATPLAEFLGLLMVSCYHLKEVRSKREKQVLEATL